MGARCTPKATSSRSGTQTSRERERVHAMPEPDACQDAWAARALERKAEPMTRAPTEPAASKDDVDGVMSAALDYIDGFTQGDPDRHARAYHPECVKRRFVTDEESGVEELLVFSPRVMADYAATGRYVVEDCEAEIIIDAISEDIASVRIYSCRWVDFCHIVKARSAWRLFHVTWHRRSDQ